MMCETLTGTRAPLWEVGSSYKLRFGPNSRAEMWERGTVRFGSLLPFSRQSQLLVCETDGLSGSHGPPWESIRVLESDSVCIPTQEHGNEVVIGKLRTYI
jgi:hypothetical protein